MCERGGQHGTRGLKPPREDATKAATRTAQPPRSFDYLSPAGRQVSSVRCRALDCRRKPPCRRVHRGSVTWSCCPGALGGCFMAASAMRASYFGPRVSRFAINTRPRNSSSFPPLTRAPESGRDRQRSSRARGAFSRNKWPRQAFITPLFIDT